MCFYSSVQLGKNNEQTDSTGSKTTILRMKSNLIIFLIID